MIHTTLHLLGSRINSIVQLSLVSLLAASLLISPFVSADTRPPAGTPATVSADPLPTVQINGVVWASATYGNKVYVTGKFTTATDTDGSTHARGNLLAFDITTGALDRNFNHSLDGATTGGCWSTTQKGAQGCAIDVSPDGSRLYVGGSFSTVDGQPRANGAAFDLTRNVLINGFTGMSNTVRAIDSSDTQVFVGGLFGTVNGVARSRLAAFNADGTLNTGWVANITSVRTDTTPAPATVYALAIAGNQGNLLIGGTFNRISGVAYNALGAVKLSNAALVTTWASKSATTFPITQMSPAGPDNKLGYTSISYDGTQAYATTFNSFGRPAGSFEGRAAFNPANGNLIWMNPCNGDSYDAQPIGQVLYSVSHAHDCRPVAGYPETGSGTAKRGLAESTYANGTVSMAIPGSPSYVGKPKAELLNWFPVLTPGSYTGAGQAAWTVTGNAGYIVLGGEFPRVNGVAQQGLTRYATAANAPNKIGPTAEAYRAGKAIMVYPAAATGAATVRTYVTGDPDNGMLTYEVYRKGETTPRATRTIDSRYWRGTSWTFNDTGVPQGTSLDYDLVVKDPYGNAIRVNNASAFDNTDARITKTGTWTSLTNRPDNTYEFARSTMYTNTLNGSYTTTFYGSSVTVYGAKAANRGTFSVSIDGGAATTHTAANAATLIQQPLYTKTGLALGRHTIKVTNTQSGKYIDLDSISVTQDKVIDSTSPAITYTGAWTTRQTGVNNYGGGIRYTAVKGATARTTFNGTQVAIMTERGPGRGTYSVSIDGAAPVNCNANYTAVNYQWVTCRISGLAPGNHTLVMTNTSTVASRVMDIDAIFYR